MDNTGNIILTNKEASLLSITRLKHCIWVDQNKKVKWRLKDYNLEQQEMLWKEKYILYGQPDYWYFSKLIDRLPMDGYEFAKNYVTCSEISTTYNIIDWLRSDFRHSTTADITDAYTLKEALTQKDKNGKRVSRGGCHTMCRILQSLLISVNIPCYKDNGWIGKGHAGLFIEGAKKILVHGDDIYTTTFKTVTTNKLLMDYNYFNKKIKSLGKSSDLIKKREWMK